ncbi:MAG TPA: acyl-CoA dehydrogenase family protein, partial [Solirubrobacteraceae bacterium]|nr:acyl-CoA dehydrogenase family protein [Solirubrobacteraceae bacterium]
MSVQAPPERTRATPVESLEQTLERIAARASDLDREPRFPIENFSDLATVGALAPPSDGLAGEVRLVRAVAAADASTARILDGHLNGIERLTLAGPEPLRSAELAQMGEGRLLLGVWGADPAAGEGPPARLEQVDGQMVLRGVKTFCSGAGGVQRALVIAADQDGSRRLAYIDTTSRVNIDRGWYRASGLRSSESHRVEFHATPVLALLGAPGELSREPYFSRDAIRTSATWAGLADRILTESLAALDPARLDAVQAHSLGRMRIAKSTINRWLDHTTTVLDQPLDTQPTIDPAVLAVECRIALYESALLISGQAARICGSRALIGASALDRARRDL